jgi:hypothetical protein
MLKFTAYADKEIRFEQDMTLIKQSNKNERAFKPIVPLLYFLLLLYTAGVIPVFDLNTRLKAASD